MDPTSDTGVTDATDADLDADDLPGDQVTLVKTGMVRIWIGGQRYRLRRPFFGELKTLRLALEGLQDEVNDKQVEILDLAAQLEQEANDLAADEDLTAKQRAAKLRQIRRRDRDAARKLTDLLEQLYPDWWAKVFEMLSVDGKPDDWPAWVTDVGFVQRLMQHWRQAPLAPG